MNEHKNVGVPIVTPTYRLGGTCRATPSHKPGVRGLKVLFVNLILFAIWSSKIFAAEIGSELDIWKEMNLTSSEYYKSEFCEKLLDDAVNHPEKFEIINPIIETNDIEHPLIKTKLDGCDLHSFIQGEETIPRRMDFGEDGSVLTFAETGVIYYASDHYAVYELKLNETLSGTSDLIFYTGPRYKYIEDKNTGQKLKKYSFGGVFHRITQPGCKVGSPTTVQDLLSTNNYKQYSNTVFYRDEYYLLVVHTRMRSTQVLKEQGRGKTNLVCSFYEKE